LHAESGKFYEIKFDEACSEKYGERCDFVLFLDDKSVVLFVELKGNDLKKAFSQILHSLVLLKESFERSNKYAAIVYSGTPKVKMKTQDMKEEAWQKHKVMLFVGSQKLTLKYENGEIQKA